MAGTNLWGKTRLEETLQGVSQEKDGSDIIQDHKKLKVKMASLIWHQLSRRSFRASIEPFFT